MFPLAAARRAAPLAAAIAAAFPGLPLRAHEPVPAPERTVGVVTIIGSQPSSLPTQIPTTTESITRQQIADGINATDAEDALKYLPSLLVRKRYVGDYNHAVLSTRASGSGNSARSLVYADGVLLSNLLGNGAAFAPRWGLVTPEEIERVDVLYGPFSAAYAGNSVGAVVDMVTRMPRRFEAHAKVNAFTQRFDLYGTRGRFDGHQASVSLGDRQGGCAWWVNLNRLDSESPPQVFVTRTADKLPAGSTGAVPARDRNDREVWVLGTNTQYHTVQDHAKFKLAYELSEAVRATVTLGGWRNHAGSRPDTYLRDAAGAPAYVSDFSATNEQLLHLMQALSIKRHTHAGFDWELAASGYQYRTDRVRTPGTAMPAAEAGSPGRETRLDGTGWTTLVAKAVWRPEGGAHVVDAGLQQERYRLRSRVTALADWRAGTPLAPDDRLSRFEGNTELRSAYAQDAWAMAPEWKLVLGLRAEQWRAWGGLTESACCALVHPQRSLTALSPKAALSHQVSDHWVLKASTGRALRFPTVAELYQGGFNAQGQAINNDPGLRPERSWTGELTAEWGGDHLLWRTTAFHENTHDALYSQLNPATNANTVQNVGRIRTNGLEAALQIDGLLDRRLDLNASATYADSRILDNAGYVSVPGDTVGKQQPRVPRWRASASATWRAGERWTLSAGARYGSRAYNTLDNSDVNGSAYQGVSKYWITDLRVRYRIARQWTASLGIDNLNNARTWNFHPYPQRTTSAELAFDL
ncbi:TonB-dependent receptor [Ideonella sp. BN130291]|uniref:TonB-dependent receptor n=1 Tax=Ideonella sp. BN130291 TaxID=3112940 RepID=UPI002E272FC0|nr:TonB-dependent receptor [Ideonella sp. BN130291]